jgi:hypothetical protein
MRNLTRLRLSLSTVPELSIGRAPLTPQNSQFDARRVRYLEGMVAYLNGPAVRDGEGRAETRPSVQQMLTQLPYSDLVEMESGASKRVREVPGARDRIVFNQEHLRINFLDGLHRRTETVGIPASRYVAQISSISSRPFPRDFRGDAFAHGAAM